MISGGGGNAPCSKHKDARRRLARGWGHRPPPPPAPLRPPAPPRAARSRAEPRAACGAPPPSAVGPWGAGGARAEQVRWERWGSPPGPEGPSASGDTPSRAVPPRVAALGAAPVPWRGAGGRAAERGGVPGWCPMARALLGGFGVFWRPWPFPGRGLYLPPVWLRWGRVTPWARSRAVSEGDAGKVKIIFSFVSTPRLRQQNAFQMRYSTEVGY